MKKIKTILRAWWKLLKGEETRLSKKRLEICKKCPEKIGAICSLCGCVLVAKVLEDDEHCPLGKW